MSSPIIQTQNLTRRFGDHIAVNGLDFEVHQGEVFGFLGHNGAGKTTTIRLLNGVLMPDGGSARVLGLSPAEDGPQIRARTGILTETPSIDERLTARDNLTLYAEIYGVPVNEVRARVDEMLDTFDLLDRADEKAGGYSKGMKQRLALARAFLHKPELLFLDEPTSGLDPVSMRQVHEMIQHISQDEGRTVFICTHNLTEAQRLCQRVGVMEQGRLAAIGTPVELASQIGMNTRYEIEVAPEQIEAAARIIQQAVTLCERTSDTTLNITVTNRENIPDLLAQLTAGGVRVYQLAQHEASLEDIYFTLHRS